ncbi:MAG: hypothetical protein V4445_04800 [Pseudomonadota bacterium]
MVLMRSRAISRAVAQKGAVLMMMALVLLLAGTTALLSILDSSGVKIKQDNNTAMALASAKAALIGFSVKSVNAGTRPGDLIRPDFASEATADYDGTADASCLDATKVNGLPLVSGSSGVNMRCLGRLPWKDLGISIHVPLEADPSGIMPWYAVSANLVDPTCLTVLNSNTLSLVNNPPPAALDCSGATLPYPWLTVRDGNGNILSNRVAAVILIPGAVRGAQSRSSAALSAASQYLDSLIVPVGCTAPCVPGTYSNADMDNDFVMASENTSSALASEFNDQLVYITIDELMEAVVKRAAGEARSVLIGYQSQNGHYPYAVPLGSALNNFTSSGISTTGMLPIDGTDTCSCSSGTSCTCAYSLVNSVAHTRSSGGSYTVNTGLCTRSGSKCTCTGVGQCRNASSSRKFTCVAGGSCTFVGSGTSPLFTYTPKSTHGNVTSASSGCTVSGSNAVCNASGSFRVGLNLPLWFSQNIWQDDFYYQWSPASDLQFGSHGAIAALVIGTGSVITNTPFTAKGSAQTRPSSNLTDYLDSIENTNGNMLFDAIGTVRNSSYNDQMFIVAP